MTSTGPHPHIVFAGGGTGGHLFPGLAVAQRLTGDVPRARITFAGSGRQFERRYVTAAGFEYLALPCHPLPRRLRDVLPFVAENVHGYREAGQFVVSRRVSAVVGLGGYTSVPMARAAVRGGVPLVLLEQNAVPGRATRWLAPHAAIVCTAFAEASQYLGSRCPVRVTGNPIRPHFTRRLVVEESLAACERREGPATRISHGDADRSNGSDGDHRSKILLVLGGTRGARSLNESVPWALHKVGPALAGWRIGHQSGREDVEATRALYRKLGLKATVVPFIARLPRVLAQADLAICRAGGTTLAELAATGLPAILLPYTDAADDHQRKNADVFAQSGASLTLDARELPGRLDDHLAGAVALLAGNPARRAAMAEAMRRLAQPDAAWDVAAMVRQVAACGVNGK
jgi:UDP-N-acetylglucosamine--N-acetylmuramyl-(pentapeptide) pyrophosphoryl-undecaprenol N-acetylglucosamine transferase